MDIESGESNMRWDSSSVHCFDGDEVDIEVWCPSLLDLRPCASGETSVA
jgi:hypothetical protein